MFGKVLVVAGVRVTVAGLTLKVHVDEPRAVLLDPLAQKIKFVVPVAFGVPLTVKPSVLLPTPVVVVATVAQAGVLLTVQINVSEALVDEAVAVEDAL